MNMISSNTAPANMKIGTLQKWRRINLMYLNSRSELLFPKHQWNKPPFIFRQAVKYIVKLNPENTNIQNTGVIVCPTDVNLCVIKEMRHWNVYKKIVWNLPSVYSEYMHTRWSHWNSNLKFWCFWASRALQWWQVSDITHLLLTVPQAAVQAVDCFCTVWPAQHTHTHTHTPWMYTSTH